MASRVDRRMRGLEAALPEMARAVLAETGGAIDLIAVTIGPGSFTGIRAGLALAHGIGLARGVAVMGVSVGEAMAFAFPHLGERSLWTVTPARREHVFLERDGRAVSIALESLPLPAAKVAIAGEAASRAAAVLAARGADVMLTDARFPPPGAIAEAAWTRWAKTGAPSHLALPLYVDPPEAKPPSDGLRPPPTGVA